MQFSIHTHSESIHTDLLGELLVSLLLELILSFLLANSSIASTPMHKCLYSFIVTSYRGVPNLVCMGKGVATSWHGHCIEHRLAFSLN